jgi:hypothetical protein
VLGGYSLTFGDNFVFGKLSEMLAGVGVTTLNNGNIVLTLIVMLARGHSFLLV